MRGPILWKYGCRGLSGYFLLNWDDEGHWVSPLASLNPQSPHSGVQLRVSDISVVSCSFIHLCWTGTACCSLLTGVLSVLFCFFPQLDSWVVNPGVVSWYLDRLFFFHPRQSCFHQCTRFPQGWSEDLLTILLGVLSSGPRFLNWRSSGIWDWAAWAFRCPGFQHDGPSPALDFLRVPRLLRELHWVGFRLCLAFSTRRFFQPGYIQVTAP